MGDSMGYCFDPMGPLKRPHGVLLRPHETAWQAPWDPVYISLIYKDKNVQPRAFIIYVRYTE